MYMNMNMYEAAAVYSGLAIDVQRHLLYFSDEGQGQVGELKLKVNYTVDMTSRVVDSTAGSRPRSIAVDTVNRSVTQTNRQTRTHTSHHASRFIYALWFSAKFIIVCPTERGF